MDNLKSLFLTGPCIFAIEYLGEQTSPMHNQNAVDTATQVRSSPLGECPHIYVGDVTIRFVRIDQIRRYLVPAVCWLSWSIPIDSLCFIVLSGQTRYAQMTLPYKGWQMCSALMSCHGALVADATGWTILRAYFVKSCRTNIWCTKMLAIINGFGVGWNTCFEQRLIKYNYPPY